MKIASVADVKASFDSYLKHTEKGAVVITRKGKPVAVLLAVTDDDEVEEIILTHSPKLRAIFEAAEKRFRAGEGIPADEFKKQLDAEYAEAEQAEKKPRATKRA